MGEGKGGLSIQYETLAEAEMRLNNTLVLYQEEPVWINRIQAAAAGDPKEDIFRVYAIPLPNIHIRTGGPEVIKEEFRKFISSRNFDMRTIRMGFLNVGDDLWYCSRAPARQYKQGLSNETFRAYPLVDTRGVGNVRLSNLLGEQALVDMIKGIYPTFEEALEQVKSGAKRGVAFSRNYALVSDADLDGLVFVFHKGDKVGFIVDDNVIKLSEKTKCLKESLAELGLKI